MALVSELPTALRSNSFQLLAESLRGERWGRVNGTGVESTPKVVSQTQTECHVAAVGLHRQGRTRKISRRRVIAMEQLEAATDSVAEPAAGSAIDAERWLEEQED